MKHLLTLLLLIGTLGLVGCGGSGPGDAVKDFTAAMEAGDTEKVKELAPAMGMAGEKLDGMVQQMAMEIKKKEGIKEIEITEEKIDGETATVEFTTHFGDGSSEGPESMELAKIDGKWIIDMGDESSDKPGQGGAPIDFSAEDVEEEPTEE